MNPSLSQHPGSFYFYEPLHYYSYIGDSDRATIQSPVDFVSSLFQVNKIMDFLSLPVLVFTFSVTSPRRIKDSWIMLSERRILFCYGEATPCSGPPVKTSSQESRSVSAATISPQPAPSFRFVWSRLWGWGWERPLICWPVSATCRWWCCSETLELSSTRGGRRAWPPGAQTNTAQTPQWVVTTWRTTLSRRSDSGTSTRDEFSCWGHVLAG